MSEEFDREAERERLRKQLEEDEEDRKATQRMSELLLQGATMTNKHCDQCGDPIFRWQDQEFCPTCERVVGEVDSEASDDAEESADGDVETPAPPDAGAGDVSDAGAADESEPPDDVDRADATVAAPGVELRSSPAPDTEGMGSAGAGPPAKSASGDGDLSEARAALARTLTTLARQAEATDDVGRARSLLAAAREAAEALAAVDEVGR